MRTASNRVPTGTSIEAVLELALRASGTERAFLVVQDGTDGDKPRVEASRTLGGSLPLHPSRSVLRRAITGDRPGIHLDIAAEPAAWAGASVRALALRAVLTAPVPARPPATAALVLDSRRTPPPSPALLPLLELISTLAGLVLAGRPPVRPAVTGADADPLPGLDGNAPVFREMLGWLRKAAASDLPVLVEGETGCGKEFVSRALHRVVCSDGEGGVHGGVVDHHL